MKLKNKKTIESYIKKLCKLTEYNLKEIKWITGYHKVEGLELISKETTQWANFFNLYHTYSTIMEIGNEWNDFNEDVADQTTILTILTESIDAFGEKDGIFYCVETDKLIKPIDMKFVG